MTQADRVLSTPPINTSALPADPTRRGFLAQAAVAAAGGAALGVTLPLPGSAQSPSQVRDPIYAAIERHRELSTRYDAAVAVSAKLFDGPEWEAAEKITDAACAELFDFADNLVCSQPTTLAGVIALLRYAAAMQEWEMPREIPDEDGKLTHWSNAIFMAVVNTLDQIGVQS